MSDRRTLRVGVDISPAISGDTGVARYAEGLVADLWERRDLEIATLAFGRGPRATTLEVDRRVPVPLRVLRPWWRVTPRPRAEDLVGPVDVVHAIDGVPPPTRQPVVVTCHDVLPLTHPHLYDRRYRAIARAHVAALHDAAAVVTTCHATADAITTAVGLAPGRIGVAPPGRRFLTTSSETTAAEPYVLYVGAITPRKGLHRLVAALAAIDDPPPLVVAGPDGMRAAEVHDAVAPYAGRLRIEWRGRVDDDSLGDLLRRAALLCHPSEAEGFGIPVLEAMGAGVPVVAADIGPVREVGGDAVALLPVHDRDAWASTIRDLLSDPDRRERMRLAGLARSAPYTWSAMADRVIDVYRAVTSA